MEEKNQIKSLLDIYKEFVTEQDKKGWADFYKQATETIFKDVNIEIDDRKTWQNKKYNQMPNLTIEDIHYEDGYFIFGTGTNTVIDFHIKEIPGWLFGIWWNEPKKFEDSKSISASCELFAQYEANIDKFKPSRSELCLTVNVIYGDEKYKAGVYSLVNMLNFMHAEPELAFCRDYCGWDYNEEYHTRAEAKKEFTKYLKWQANKDEQEKLLDQRMIDKVKELFKEEFNADSMILLDRGDNWSPRYDLILNKDLYEEFKDTESGCYHFSDLYSKDILKAFKAEEKACEKISNKYKFYWFSPMDAFIKLVDTERFSQIAALRNTN